ncbi:hypothetical protein CQY20_08265 [Mycolicibacterium agri]|uniref:Uncharacterized protein n=1 Tax=Mycolicibacterium agri TaxID=36811 RepID=A0A2A7N8N4_MYCAG|nr:hypothetical protein [Mycolicibacterium agri]PEG40226.1 hypothetical protein CQY20_08265 [Mycolicibacterium agri]GFG55716.1 hypothetical protein MAGR_71570 [Mycolicibacterium agri]
MKRVLGAAAGGVLGAAAAFGVSALITAAPASAEGMNFNCAPCVGDVNGDGVNNPVWDELTSFGPWEGFFDPDGDGNGAWENGVQAVNGGAWEKVFPSEPAEPSGDDGDGGDGGDGA